MKYQRHNGSEKGERTIIGSDLSQGPCFRFRFQVKKSPNLLNPWSGKRPDSDQVVELKTE